MKKKKRSKKAPSKYKKKQEEEKRMWCKKTRQLLRIRNKKTTICTDIKEKEFKGITRRKGNGARKK